MVRNKKESMLEYFFSVLLVTSRYLSGCRYALLIYALLCSLLLLLGIPKRFWVVWSNLTYVFSDQSFKDRLVLFVKHFFSIGQGVVEAFLAWAMPISWWTKRLTIQGESVLSATQETGALLLTPHMHTLEILPKALAVYGQTLHLVFQRSHLHGVGQKVTKLREEYARCLVHTQVRAIRRVLHSKKLLGLLPDQCMRGMAQVQVPFLGKPAWTITSPIRLSARAKVPIVVIYCERLVFAKEYRLVVQTVKESTWTGDVTKDTATINALLGDVILAQPARYYWFHRRFKGIVGDSDSLSESKMTKETK